MRIFVTVVIMLTAFLSGRAEGYVVYSVHGDVWEQAGAERHPIMSRDSHLADDSRIGIGKGGSITVYLTESREMVSINEKGVQRLSTLVKRSRASRKSPSRMVASLIGSLLKSDTPEQTGRRMLQSQGGSHRGDGDDRALMAAFGNYLAGKDDGVAGISMRVVDGSGNVLLNPIDYEGPAYFEIDNLTDHYLFLNVVAVDAAGAELLLPVDPNPESPCCAHLCVPPASTVVMSEMPFFPSLLTPGSRFIAVASPNEVNFTVLCGSCNDSTDASGTFYFYSL